MQFYKVILKRKFMAADSETVSDYAIRKQKSFCCVEQADERAVQILAAVSWNYPVQNLLSGWCQANSFCASTADCTEISVQEFMDALGNCDVDDRIQSMMNELGMGVFQIPPAGLLFSSAKTEMPESKTALRAYCKDNLLPTLREELERIFSPTATHAFLGHPVHYFLEEDFDTDDQLDVLLTALHMAGRLKSREILKINLNQFELPEELLNDAYRVHQGGTVVLPLQAASDSEKIPTELGTNLQTALRLSKKYADTVLTIFVIPPQMNLAVIPMLNKDLNMIYLQLTGGSVGRAAASRYLLKLAEERNLTEEVNVNQLLFRGQKHFLRRALRARFDNWQSSLLCTKAYPAYDSIAVSHQAEYYEAAYEDLDDDCVMETHEEDPMQELEHLVGLSEVKQIIHQAVDYSRAQKLFASRGYNALRLPMHMVFTGNPGTAKTTVARLLGRICKEYGLLSKGDLIEVSRQDLVGKFVGWTANAVNDAFRKAKGCVLFIDEAYSLVDGQHGSFGDEAITAIVQQMENSRQDTIVIFAGYPEKMAELLERNEGLRSRIGFHVNFPDYSDGELFCITEQLLTRQQRKLAPEAETKVRRILEYAMHTENFGNGRFARTVAEKALLRQASRLMKIPEQEISNDDIQLLLPEDFEEPQQQEGKRTCIPIGFAC